MKCYYITFTDPGPTPMKRSSTLLDAGAIALSSLCLLHCLALPILAATLPLFGVGRRPSGCTCCSWPSPRR